MRAISNNCLVRGEEMLEAKETFRQMVKTIYAEWAGQRSMNLDRNGAENAIASSLTSDLGIEVATDVAFHLSDCSEDAAFLVALHLFPERFTSEEIRDGLQAFLIHVPNHIAAAAHLAKWHVRDVFKVGLTIES